MQLHAVISLPERGEAILTVNWVVFGLGVIVSLLGYYLIPSDWGYGILGFGLAHILLGILSMFRRPVRDEQASN
ncbi:hypothetical protein [Paenibacillus glucanolyticus]|uniref:hypothetical protein n=1 Tax=Paenibacillus glucanolyticus TaxID=59843 RepID=UPI0034CF6A4F